MKSELLVFGDCDMINRYMNNKSVKEQVKFGASPKEIAERLRLLTEVIEHFAEWTKSNCSRDEKNLIIYNLLSAFIPYANLYSQNLAGQIPVLALCTRAVYELNTRIRLIALSTDYLKEWQAEAADDHIQILEAVIKGSDQSDIRVNYLKTEIDRVKGLKVKYSLPNVKMALDEKV